MLNDLTWLDAYLRRLAEAVRAAAGDSWVVAVLDARFSDRDGAAGHQVRVVQADGTVGTVPLPADAPVTLDAIGQPTPRPNIPLHRPRPTDNLIDTLNTAPAGAVSGWFGLLR